jgi:hypothetical protein
MLESASRGTQPRARREQLELDPEKKPAPDLDPGRIPVFGKEARERDDESKKKSCGSKSELLYRRTRMR